MKTKFYLVVFVLIFFSLQTFCQKSSDFKIEVGGQSILIPPTDTGFVEVGDTIREMYEPLFGGQNILKAVFLPVNIVQKFGIEAINYKKLKYAVITVSKTAENGSFSENDFIEFKKDFKSKIPRNLPEYSKNAKRILLKLNDVLGKQEVGTPVPLATALDIEDAYACIILTTVNSKYGLQSVLGGSLNMRLKNKILNFNIYNYQVNEESLAWIYNTIKVWSLLLFASNEDSVPNKINSSVDNVTGNRILSPIHNMVNSISFIFQALITKTPITFICTIIIIILYYFTTRKLFPIYLKNNHSSVYLFFKKLSDFFHKHPLLLIIWVLFELLCVLVIIISIIKVIGLSTPF
ncbi:MAG: hypothetical protein ABR974_01000 [Bacteroidales bacterium]|jgi:hypothetical protein